MGKDFEDRQKLDKLLSIIEEKEEYRRKLDEAALPELVKEGFPTEGGATYPPEDFPREGYVSPRLKREVLGALSQAGYNFKGSDEAWEDESTGIIVYFNWAPLWRSSNEGDFESEGWGRIFVDAFGRSQDVGENRARLEAGRIARLIRGVPGIKNRHFVGVVVCEGL